MDQKFVRLMRLFANGKHTFDKMYEWISEEKWNDVGMIFDAFIEILCEMYGWDPELAFDYIWEEEDYTDDSLRVLYDTLEKECKIGHVSD